MIILLYILEMGIYYYTTHNTVYDTVHNKRKYLLARMQTSKRLVIYPGYLAYVLHTMDLKLCNMVTVRALEMPCKSNGLHNLYYPIVTLLVILPRLLG